MINLEGIDAVIFDFGGVIINLDTRRSIDALHTLSKLDLQNYNWYENLPSFFDDYEEGKLSCREFRDLLREQFKVEATDSEIDQAFCELLLETPNERIELLQTLKNRLPIFLYSNTCEIHRNFFIDKIKK